MTAHEIAERWLAEEEDMRRRTTPQAGLAPPAQLEKRSGLEILEAMMAGELPRAPMGETLDFLLIAAAPGSAVFQGRPRLRHYNPLGTVHGGWFATLLDSAMGCAVQSTLPVGKAYATMEFKVNLVRALGEEVPVVRAEGKVVHAGQRSATAEGRLVGPDGKLYAHATTTCLVFDRKPLTPSSAPPSPISPSPSS